MIFKCVDFVIYRVIPNSIFKAKHVRTRTFIADQLSECKDLSGLFYCVPFQKGYLVNCDLQKQVWDYAFATHLGNPSLYFKDDSIILTEPLFNFPSIQDLTDQLFFEEYQFNELVRVPAPYLSQVHYLYGPLAHGLVQPEPSTDDSTSFSSSKRKTGEPSAKITRRSRRSAANGDAEAEALSSTMQHQPTLRPVRACLVVDSGYSFTHIVPFINDKLLLNGVKR